MSVYSIARSQLCFNWVLDYVSMRLLSPTQSLETIRPQFSSSGTHRINTRRNVTVPDVSVFHRKKSIVFQLGAWLCKHETALLIQFIWRPSVSSCAALALTESIQVVMSLYLMSVYSITRSQLCWDWVLDYVSMRLLSLIQFIWRPSVLQLCCSGTHRINTRSNVTVPDVSVFHRRSQLCWDWVLDYVSMRLLSSYNSFGDHPSPSSPALALTESIQVVMSLYLMWVYSITRSQLCWDWVLDYVSMRLLSLTQFIGDHPSSSCAALALTESIHW